MTQIKKITDKQGNDIYLRTHTKAVVDDNGYTAESRLQAMQDEINQAQLEVGAVPSDLTPTEGSTNWVTSGGLYNQLNIGDANVDIDLTQYTAVRAFPNPDKWLVTSDNYPYYGIFIPVVPNQKYRIKANSSHTSFYGFLTTNTYSHNASVSYATGCTRISVPSDTEIIDIAPNDAHYLWVATYTTVDITPQKVEVYNKKSVAEILENSDTTPQKNSENLITSSGVYNSISPIDEDLYGKRIYNNFESGKYIEQESNNIKSNANWALTEYIPVTPYDTVRIVFQTTGQRQISCATFYDGNKQAINSWTSNGYTNERTIPAEVSEGETGSRAYVRCGLYLTNIETCEVYINDVLVWNYTGRGSSGITDEIEKIPQIESDIDELKEADKCKFATSFGTLKSPSYCIASSNNWSSTTKHSVYFKEVVEGDVYRFLGNVTTYGYYAFLKDTSMSSYGSPNYADGETGRHLIPINTESSDITVPATAVYLYICKTNDGTDQEPQALYKVTPTADAVESISEDVTNIKDKLGMNDGSSEGFSYYGEKITFYNTMSFTKYASNSVSGQSSAIYGDYLFIVKDYLTNVICYNMATKTVLYNLSTGFSKDSTWHCNQCQFGTLRYSQDDMFPVLYITVTNNAQGRCSWVAYRIIPTLTDNEISSFTIEQVQEIFLPAMTDENCLGNFNIAVDYERGVLWGYGRNNNSNAENYQKATFACFPMPSLSEQTVTYEDSDIITSFMDTWWMAYAQGGFIKNGKLVIMQGYASVNLINLRVIDLYVAKRQVSYANLLENGFTEEPEGVFFYNGSIYTSTNNSNIWKMNI